MKTMFVRYGSQRDYDVPAGRHTREGATMHRHMESVHRTLAGIGERVVARGRSAPVHARRVQLRAGVPVVTDGPYPETREVLAGCPIVGRDRYDGATPIAAGLDSERPP